MRKGTIRNAVDRPGTVVVHLWYASMNDASTPVSAREAENRDAVIYTSGTSYSDVLAAV